MAGNCNQTVIKLRQGDDSNFNDNHIIFHIVANYDLTGWKAKFRLQNEHWDLTITDGKTENDKEVELIITRNQTNSMDTGTCYGWLQLIDENGNKGTVYSQKFQILKREVW